MKKTWKRVITILLALLCMTIPSMPAAAETYGDNLMRNGSFEFSDKDGNPEGWEAYQGWNGGFCMKTGEKSYAGGTAVKVTTLDGGLPWVRYKVPISPNTGYRITAKVFTEKVEGRVAGKLEFYTEEGRCIGETTLQNLEIKEGQWADYIGTTDGWPGEVAYMLVYMRLYGTGTVWFDEVSVYQSSKPLPCTVTTDEIFFYPEWTEGNATIIANIVSYGNTENGTVDVYLKDGDTILEQQKGMLLKKDRVTWTFPTAKMTEEAKEYTIEAVVYGRDGKEEGTCNTKVYMYNRPTALDAEGNYYDENGELFVPHIMYHVHDYGINGTWDGKEAEALLEYELLAKAGYNTVQMSPGVFYSPELTLKSLDKLHEFGLKGMVPLYDGFIAPSRPERIERATKLIEAIKDHPAVFAYGVFDEPTIGANGLTEQDLIDTYRLIRSIDKKHPTFVVLAPTNHNESYTDAQRTSMIKASLTKYVDVVCYDPYVATWDDVFSTYVYEIHKAADEFVYHNRPSYSLIQTCDWRGFFPTEDEYRHMFYQGMIGGSEGVGAYSFYDALSHDGTGGPNRPLYAHEVWEEMTEFGQEELGVADEYFYSGKYPVFNELKTKDYLYRSYVDGNDLYVVVLRLDETRATSRDEQPPVRVSIPLVSQNGLVSIGDYTAEILYGAEKTTQIGNGTLDINLEWRKALVYKIKPNTTIDYSEITVAVDDYKTDVPPVSISGINDMDGYNWAAEAVKEMVEGGAMASEGFFRPGENITRGEFAGALIRTLNLRGNVGEAFSDVPSDYGYATEIGIGRHLGILNGRGDGTFGKDDPITRQDIVTIVYRALQVMEKDMEIGELSFPDAVDIAEYAKDAVGAMTAAGVIVGNETGAFMPKNNTTRAEAAIILQRVKNTEWKRMEEVIPDAPAAETPVIIFNEGEVSEEESAKREEAVKLLEAIGITEKEDIVKEEAVTRRKAAKILVRLLGDTAVKNPESTSFSDVDEQDELSGYIKASVDMGLMSGYGDGSFGADDPLTYNAAVKILVDALGYKAHAESLGGYFAGYLTLANQLALTKGIKILEGPIRGGAFARLLENALQIPIASRETFGEDADLSFVSDAEKTILSENHGILKYEGKLSQTFMAQLSTSGETLKPGQVVINGKILGIGGTNAEALFARRVIAYAPKGEEVENILYIRVKENNTEEVIDAADILSGNDGLLIYETEKGEEKVSLTGAQLVYNGRPESWETEWMPKTGKITLISQSGNLETVVVDAYENYVVDSIDSENDLLFFKDKTDYPSGLEVSAQDKMRKVVLCDASGHALTVKDCDEWNVISVAKSLDGSLTRAIRCSKSITGRVTEVSGETVTIDGIEYRIAPNLREDETAKKPSLSQNAIHYLDMMGEIAAVDGNIKEYMYGFLVAGEITKSVDQQQKLKIFNENGNMVILNTADTVTLNGTPKTGTSLLTDTSVIFSDNKVQRQLIRYVTSEDGSKVKEIYTAEDFTKDFASDRRLETFSLDEHIDEENRFLYAPGWQPGTFYGGFMRMFGNRYLAREKTKIFMIPKEGAGDDEYVMMDQSTLKHASEGTPLKNSYIYDTDEDSVVSAIVWYTDSGASLGGKVPNYDTDIPGIITGFSTVLNKDGEAVQAIRIMNQQGAEVTLITNEEQKVYFQNVLTDTQEDPLTPSGTRAEATIPLVKKDASGKEYITLDVGDVIHYSVDKDGVIQSLNCLFRNKYPKTEELCITSHTQIKAHGSHFNYEGLNVAFAKVLHAGAYGVSVETNIFGKADKAYPTYIYGGMLLYDSKTESVRTITKDEIREGDLILHVRKLYYTSFMVIYR